MLKNFIKKSRRVNYTFLVVILLISILGLTALVSTTIGIDGQIIWQGTLSKQILFLLIGLILYFAVSRTDYQYLRYLQVSGILHGLVVLMLILTLWFGPIVHHSQRWLEIGTVRIQPSEFAKLTTIILTASILSLHREYDKYLLVLISFVPAVITSFLLYLQPHGSMALIIIALWFLTVFTYLPDQISGVIFLLITFAGVLWMVLLLSSSGITFMFITTLIISLLIFVTFKYRRQYIKIVLVLLLFGVLIGGIGSYSWDKILLPHQKARVEAFINPEETAQGAGFNVDQARVAIGSGRLLGKGFGYGTQSKLSFLPEQQTDFIFAAFGEEFGFLGLLVLLSLYAIVIFMILYSSMDITDSFGRVLLGILALKILMEVFINVGTNTGLVPATGIPLPLFSAGGSITLATFITLGLVQSVWNHQVE